MPCIAFTALRNMPTRWRLLTATCLSLLLLPTAAAMTVLSVQVSDVTCQITRPSGVEAVTCVTLASDSIHEQVGIASSLLPGETAEVHGFIDYQYSDDGLPLPGAGFFFQLNATGTSVLHVDHEAGALYANSNNCTGSTACLLSSAVTVGGNTGFPPLVLGFNDTPDQLSGRIAVSGSMSVAANAATPESRDIFIGWTAISISGVTPIPEPETYALMLAGLGALTLASRRRNPGRSHPGRPSRRQERGEPSTVG